MKLRNNKKSPTWKWEEDTEIFWLVVVGVASGYIYKISPQERLIIKRLWLRAEQTFIFISGTLASGRARPNRYYRSNTYLAPSSISVYIYYIYIVEVERSLRRSFTCRAVREGAARSISKRGASAGKYISKYIKNLDFWLKVKTKWKSFCCHRRRRGMRINLQELRETSANRRNQTEWVCGKGGPLPYSNGDELFIRFQ